MDSSQMDSALTNTTRHVGAEAALDNGAGERQHGNGKTAIVLLSIALVFFIGVIANRVVFG